MAVVAFDTLKLADKLQAGGFTAEQARTAASAFADAMTGSDLATKADLMATEYRLEGKIAELKGEISGVRTELKGEISGVRTELKGELSGVRTEMKGDIARLEERIERRGAESDSRMVRWVVGTGVASVLTLGGIIVAAAWKLLQVLPH